VSRLYRSIRALVRVALDVYYTGIEVSGLENVPAEGPVLILANHHNGLVDPMLVVATSERSIRFLAKAPLFRIPVLGAFVRGMGAVPVHRRQDPGYDKSKNEAVYAAVGAALAAGGAVGIFPEGKSHTDPWVAEFKHGAARMALEAERSRDFAMGLRVLLVGIHFERTRLFRGKALVIFAPPLTLEDRRERYAEDPRREVEALTAALHERLRAMVLEAEDAEIVRLADLVEETGVLGEGRPGLKGSFDRKKRLLEVYRRLRAQRPAEIERLVHLLRRYRDLLRMLGLSDSQVGEDRPLSRGLSSAFAQALALLATAPLAAVGFVFNVLPYQAVLRGVVLQARTSDVRASSGLVVATVVFPLWYGLLALVGWLAPPPWTVWLPVLVLAGPCGLVAVRWLERMRALARTTGALWVALHLPRVRERLRSLRAEAIRQIEDLADREARNDSTPGLERGVP